MRIDKSSCRRVEQQIPLKRPIAFYNWSPRKVSAYSANSCVSTS